MTRPYRATLLKVMAPLSFVLASLAIYWAMLQQLKLSLLLF